MSNRRKRLQALAARRGWSAPAAVVGVSGLLVWGVGAADAATGGSFILGAHNYEGKTAILSNKNGTPLSLTAKSGYPPLAVNSSKLVPHLNANFVGGLSSTQLQRRVAGTCGMGIAAIKATGGVTCGRDQLVFKSDGTFVVPAGVSEVTGELWGGGGGGGGNYYTALNYPGSGGGAGAYVRVILDVTPGEKLSVTVGAPGSGGAAGGVTTTDAGADGGASTLAIVGGSQVASAGGGGGGPAGTGLSSCAPTGPGGQPSVTFGDTVIPLDGTAGAAGRCGAYYGGPGAGGGSMFSPGSGGTGGSHNNGNGDAGLSGHAGLVILSLGG